MGKIFYFNSGKPFFKKSISESETQDVKKVMFSACIFSTANNRNKAYFQVSELLKYKEKLGKMLTSFDHNLKLTGGKYMSNLTKYDNLIGKIIDGELEIWVDVESTDPEFIKNIDNITAPSIEVFVNEKTMISNENGDYFVDFEWVGISWLLGVPAGSGDARLDKIKKFEKNHQEKIITITMNEEEVKALLEAQKQELLKEFSNQTDQLKVEFNKKLSEEKSGNSGEYTYINEKGETCKTTWASAYQSLTEILETGEVKEDSPLILMMKAKKFKLVKDKDEKENEEKDEELLDVAKAVTKAEKFASKMQSVRTDEELEDQSNASAKTKDVNFNLELKNLINNNINI